MIRDTYRSDPVQFGALLADRRRDVLAVEHGELAAFVEELASGRAGTPPLAGATLARKIACLRSFYRPAHGGADHVGPQFAAIIAGRLLHLLGLCGPYPKFTNEASHRA